MSSLRDLWSKEPEKKKEGSSLRNLWALPSEEEKDTPPKEPTLFNLWEGTPLGELVRGKGKPAPALPEEKKIAHAGVSSLSDLWATQPKVTPEEEGKSDLIRGIELRFAPERVAKWFRDSDEEVQFAWQSTAHNTLANLVGRNVQMVGENIEISPQIVKEEEELYKEIGKPMIPIPTAKVVKMIQGLGIGKVLTDFGKNYAIAHEKKIEELSKTYEIDKDQGDVILKYIGRVNSGLASIALAFGTAYATGGVGLAAFAFAGIAMGETYGKARDKGVGVIKATEAGVLRGVGESLWEYFGLSFLMKPGGSTPIRNWLIGVTAEEIQEIGQLMHEKVVEHAMGIEKINPGMLSQELTDTIITTFIASGLVAGGLQTFRSNQIYKDGVDYFKKTGMQETEAKQAMDAVYEGERKLVVDVFDKAGRVLSPASKQISDLIRLEKPTIKRDQSVVELVDTLVKKYPVLQTIPRVVLEPTSLPETGFTGRQGLDEIIKQNLIPFVLANESPSGSLAQKKFIQEGIKGLKNDFKVNHIELPKVTLKDIAKYLYKKAPGLMEKEGRPLRGAINKPSQRAFNPVQEIELIKKDPEVTTNPETRAMEEPVNSSYYPRLIKVDREPIPLLKGRDVKPIIRAVTGQVRIGDLISTRIAFKEALKAQAKGAKIGAQYATNLAKEMAKFNKENQAIRNEVAQLIKSIKRTSKREGIHVDYKSAMKQVSSWFDLKWRSKTKLGKLDSLQSFIDKQTALGIDPKVPNQFVKELEQMALNEMTVNDLRAINYELVRLADLGISEFKRIKTAEDVEFELTKNVLLRSLETQKNAMIDNLNIAMGTYKTAADIQGLAIRSEFVLRALDGGKEGFWVHTFEDPVALAQEDSKRWRNSKKKAAKPYLEMFKAKDIYEKVFIKEGLALPRYMIHQLYDAQLGDLPRLTAYIHGGMLDDNGIRYKFDKYDVKKIVSTLSIEEKAAIQEIRKVFWDTFHADVNPVLKRVDNRELGYQTGYGEIRHDRDSFDYGQDAANEMFYRQTTLERRISDNFTKQREGETLAPVWGNYFDNMESALNRMGRYIYYAEIIKKHSRLLHDPDIKQALLASIGKEKYEWLANGWLDNLKTGAPIRAQGFEKVALRASSGAALSILKLNIPSALKQPTAVLRSYKEVAPAYLHRAMIETALHPWKTYNFIVNKSAYCAERFDTAIHEVMRETALQQKPLDWLTGQTSNKIGLFFMKLGDFVGAAPGMLGAYNEYLALHPGDEKGAVLHMNAVTRRTQATSFAEDLPPMMATPLGRVGYVFMTESNIVYNMQYDLLQQAKHKTISPLKFIVVYFLMAILPSLLVGMAGRGRLPEDAKEVAEDILGNNIAGFPLFGSIVGSAISYGPEMGTGIPAWRGAQEVGKATGYAWEGKPIQAGVHALKAIATFKGIGWLQPERTLTQMYQMYSGKSDDYRALIWSKYQLRTKKKKIRKF